MLRICSFLLPYEQRTAQHQTGSIVVLHRHQREVKHSSDYKERADVASEDEDDDDDYDEDEDQRCSWIGLKSADLNPSIFLLNAQ